MTSTLTADPSINIEIVPALMDSAIKDIAAIYGADQLEETIIQIYLNHNYYVLKGILVELTMSYISNMTVPDHKHIPIISNLHLNRLKKIKENLNVDSTVSEIINFVKLYSDD